MIKIRFVRWRACAAIAIFVFTSARAQDQKPAASGAAPSAETFLCRIIEAHTDPQMQVTGAVFHQADAAERAPLAKFIQENSGKTIEFETADAQVHSATLFRMKSCFGRGMLVLRSGDAHLAERSTFTLRLPAK